MAGSNSSSVTLPPRSLEPAVSPNPSNAPMREDPHGMREESFRALHEDSRPIRDGIPRISRSQREDVRLDSRIQSYHSQMSRPPYVLPWEELLAEEIPPSECAGSPSPYAEDERAHGRRSRQHRRLEPPDVASAPQHTISGGTGGSEEWHSPQQTPPNRTTQYIRDHDHDECQAWSQGSSKRRSRQPVLGVPIRSPEPIDPWRDPRREAWRGETPDFHGGLPSIRNSFATGLPGINANEGSRAPSRLTTGTPTPREEDSLDLVARQMHIGPGSRWNASGESEWLSLGTPAEFGHVRPQHMTHDTRGTPSHEGKSLAGLSRRSALSGIFHAH